MKRRFLIRAGLLALLTAPALLPFNSAMAQDIPSTSAAPSLPDPVPGAGADFSPSAATATSAYAGPPREIPKGDPCSADNPCALPSSAPHALGPLVTALGPALPRQARAAAASSSRRAALR